MIIHPIEKRVENGELVYSAWVEYASPEKSPPHPLWFRFPESYGDYITCRADGFVVSLLIAAMWDGEDITVRGPLSTRLARGIREHQHAQRAAHPKELHLVEVQCEGYVDASKQDAPSAVASAFSGGLDSFYTLWSHLPQNELFPGHALTHGLFVQGFDIPLDDTRSFSECARAYSALYRQLGLELLTVRTNVGRWYMDKKWVWSHAAPLDGAALMFGKLFKEFYIPSSSRYFDRAPWHRLTQVDPLLSTETLELVYDAPAVGKWDKTGAIAEWDATYRHLRVCPKPYRGLANCCECSKCLSMMAPLQAYGRLERYTTFSKPLTHAALRRLPFSYTTLGMTVQLLRSAWETGHRDLAFDLGIAVALAPLRWGFKYLRKPH